METERSELHTAVREGYQILLRADAEILIFENKPNMNAFYKRLSDTCMKWAREVHGEALRTEFLALEGVRDRARFGTQHYRMRMRTPWEEGKYLAVLCESELTGQWKEPQKSYHRISHVWDTETELILPLSQILQTFGVRISKSMLPFAPDGIYPDGNQMVFFRNVTDNVSFLEKRIPRNVKS